MRTLTLGESRSTIARVIGVCTTSPKVASLLNEAQERLLNRPDKPVGSMARFRICVGTDDCFSWARQIRTIEAFAVCKTPGVIRSEWFEFIGWPNGIGLQDEDNMPGTMLIDRGTSCAFDDVQATTAAPRKIMVVADQAADVGKKITLRYIDSNGQKTYSSIGGVVQEGVQLTLIAPPAGVFTPTNVATGGLYHVVKDTTQYPVRLYEVDGNTLAVTKSLAQYEPSETVPIYRRSFVPGFTNMSACDNASVDCTVNKQITALVKLQHVPVVVDNDPLVIGNLAALKLMVMAILREEQNRHDEAAVLEGKAARELDGELSSYLGDGMVNALKVQNCDLFGAGQPAFEWGAYW